MSDVRESFLFLYITSGSSNISEKSLVSTVHMSLCICDSWWFQNCLPTLCFDQVHCPGPVHLYDPRNFDDWSASEYGGYTTTELR